MTEVTDEFVAKFFDGLRKYCLDLRVIHLNFLITDYVAQKSSFVGRKLTFLKFDIKLMWLKMREDCLVILDMLIHVFGINQDVINISNYTFDQ